MPERPGQARRYAREVLGIEEVNIPQGIPRASLRPVLEPLRDLHARGLPMPRGLSFDPASFRGRAADLALYDPETDTLHVNPVHVAWADPDYRRRTLEAGQFSTGHEHGTVWHEYAHVLVHRHDPERYFLLQTQVFRPLMEDVAGEVSAYAGEDPLEFVSEVYAGHLGGRHFSEGVRHAYHTLVGDNPYLQLPPEEV